MAELQLIPIEQKFGIINPETKKIDWISSVQNPDGTMPSQLPRPPGVTHFLERYGPVDQSATFVRRRPLDGEIWTSPEKPGSYVAAPGMEWTQQCTIAEIGILNVWYQKL